MSISLRGLTRRYGPAGSRPVVDAIDLDMPTGALTTLLGPSGCGKTTTLRMIAGLETPSAGQIWIDGRDVTTLGPAERNVSLVFQSYALFPHLTVLDNVCYGLLAQGLPREAAVARARQTMAGVGLEGFDARLPSQLSGGQQQRVAVARSLVIEPAVLLFDEPLSNLDARLRRSMREEIRALQQRLGLTVVYVTHDQEEAMAVSDRIVLMDAGRIAQAGSPRELYERPRSDVVARFLGDAVLADGRVDETGRLWLGDAVVPCRRPLPAGPLRLALRTEAWTVLDAGPGLPATVLRYSYLGRHAELALSSALGELLISIPPGRTPWAPGTRLQLGLRDEGWAVVGDGGPGVASAHVEPSGPHGPR